VTLRGDKSEYLLVEGGGVGNPLLDEPEKGTLSL
jgi:hypothetical protein